MERLWYPRIGDITGVTWECAAEIDPRRLRGHGVQPEIGSLADGHRYLTWPSGTSQSPASRHASHSLKKSSAIVRRTLEALELPGEPLDYHFAIQHCTEALWKRRRDEPENLAVTERLAWLDIQLMEVRPQWAAIGDDDDGFSHIRAFSLLMGMYLREGFLREALEVAERARPFGQCGGDAEQLQRWLTAVEGESLGSDVPGRRV